MHTLFAPEFVVVARQYNVYTTELVDRTRNRSDRTQLINIAVLNLLVADKATAIASIESMIAALNSFTFNT